MSSADGESLKNEKLPIKKQFLTIYRNLRLVFLVVVTENFWFYALCCLYYQCLVAYEASITSSF